MESLKIVNLRFLPELFGSELTLDLMVELMCSCRLKANTAKNASLFASIIRATSTICPTDLTISIMCVE